MPQSGQVIAGKYVLERVIGEGAFATVWLATHTPTTRKVAIKILAHAPAKKPSVVARFLKEAKFLSQPLHPTVIKIEDLGQTSEGLPFQVMEYLDGFSLEGVLRIKKVLPWAMAVEIATFVLQGLAAAHDNDIIHRDIKPANIFLVRSKGAGPPVRLLDLGLARDLGEDKRLTMTGQVVGTANYIPPEVLLDEVDEKSKGGTKAGDIFAVGMVLYVSIAGRYPFEITEYATTPMAEVMARAQFYKSRIPLPGPGGYDPLLPETVNAVIKRALSLDPADRYQNAADMLLALEQSSEGALSGSLSLSLIAEKEISHLHDIPLLLDDSDLVFCMEDDTVVTPKEEVQAFREELAEEERKSSHSLKPPKPTSWFKKSKTGLVLIGSVVGIAIGAIFLTSLILCNLLATKQSMIATEPPADTPVGAEHSGGVFENQSQSKKASERGEPVPAQHSSVAEEHVTDDRKEHNRRRASKTVRSRQRSERRESRKQSSKSRSSKVITDPWQE